MLAIGGVLLLGCTDDNSSTRGGSANRQRSSGQGALLGAVAAQLRDLPNANVLELRPPVVMLDSTKSSDGQDVMAMVSTQSVPPDPPIYNYLSVPGNNARFRSLGVRSGDRVKIFQMALAEQREEGDDQIPVQVERALELTVAQVLNDNELLIEGGLDRATVEPMRIEVWRFVDDRMEEIAKSINRYIQLGDPAIGWEPTPDQYVIGQIVERLNQWLRGIKPDPNWQSAKLLDTLPGELRQADELQPYLAAPALARPTFEAYEGRLLQEAIWCRDIGRWVRGYESNRLEQVELVFDWVMRNVQLEPLDTPLPRRPWQALVYGRATAAERAWLFTMLCRQAGFDAVVLTPPASENQVLLVGVAVDGQLNLFDPRLGLPIPGPDGQGVATLAQVRDDDALLRQLDTDDEKYPLTADELAAVTVNVVADPFSLAHRSALVEERLVGDDAVRLSAPVAAQAERLGQLGLEEIRLWEAPFRSLQRQLKLDGTARAQAAREFVMFAWRPELWKARTLHFRGKKEQPDANSRDVLADPIDDHRDAGRLYMSRSVRPTDDLLRREVAGEKRMVYSTAKTCATYWLGLLNFDDAGDDPGRLENALRWLEMVPQQTFGDELWQGGTNYNTARTLHKLDRTEEAIERLKADESPQREGNQILARQWEATPAAPTEESGP